MATLLNQPATAQPQSLSRQPARYNPRGKVARIEQVLGEAGRACRSLTQEDSLAGARADRRLDLGRGIAWDAVVEAREDRGWRDSVVADGWFD